MDDELARSEMESTVVSRCIRKSLAVIKAVSRRASGQRWWSSLGSGGRIWHIEGGGTKRLGKQATETVLIGDNRSRLTIHFPQSMRLSRTLLEIDIGWPSVLTAWNGNLEKTSRQSQTVPDTILSRRISDGVVELMTRLWSRMTNIVESMEVWLFPAAIGSFRRPLHRRISLVPARVYLPPFLIYLSTLIHII